MEESHGGQRVPTEPEVPAPGPGIVAKKGEARGKFCLKEDSFEEGRDDKSVCYQIMPWPRRHGMVEKWRKAF